jgi:hypothetical protein
MSTNKIENFNVFKSIDNLPNFLSIEIDFFLNTNGYLNLEEYYFHINNNDDVYIFCSWTDKLELQFFTVLKKDKIKVNGIKYSCLVSFLYEYFDYLPIYCVVDFKEISILILKYFQNDKLELIAIQNTFNEVKGLRFKNTEKIHVYDSSKEDYFQLLNKKSIKRKYKDLYKNVEFETFNIFSSDSSYNYYINIIEEMHIERWAFNGITSSFIGDKYRKIFYDYPGSNRIVNVIKNKINGDIISIHFGFILQNSLLWHSPIINVKYYEYTPLEILLKTVLEYCESNKIFIFDLGLGSEEYKNRFTNSSKFIYNYYYPTTFLSKINFFVLFKNIDTIKKGLSIIKIIIRPLFTFINKFNSILFFKYKYNDENFIESKYFISVKNWQDYFEVIKKSNLKPSIEAFSRIKKGDTFNCLKIENEIVCYGWFSKPNAFYVSEINKKINFDCDLLLYDFNTPLIHRKKGYYKLLLKNICFENKSSVLGIFADKNNKISIFGILNSGFKKDKIYNGL